jgi:hypothetical protein
LSCSQWCRAPGVDEAEPPERPALLMLRADSAILCIKLQAAAWRWMRSTPYVLTALLHADKSWSFNPPAWYEKEMVSAVEQSFDHHFHSKQI